MKCPLCMSGKEPEYVIINPTHEEIIEHMDKDHDVNTLRGHFLWGHPQIDIVELLMAYIIRDVRRNDQKDYN